MRPLQTLFCAHMLATADNGTAAEPCNEPSLPTATGGDPTASTEAVVRERPRTLFGRYPELKDEEAERKAIRAARAKATRNDAIATRIKAIRTARNAQAGDHPKLSTARALKRFMDSRDWKIAEQADVSPPPKRLTPGDELALAQAAYQLAGRLSDPSEAEKYILELKKRAAEHARQHKKKLRALKKFWYGREGLNWLAYKNGACVDDWQHYIEFMDKAAKRAFRS